MSDRVFQTALKVFVSYIMGSYIVNYFAAQLSTCSILNMVKPSEKKR